MENFYKLFSDIITEEKINRENVAKLKAEYPDKAGFLDFAVALAEETPRLIHIPYETLSEYAFYLSGGNEEFKYLDRVRFKIEAHLSKCDKCRTDLEMFKEEVKSAAEFINISFAKETPSQRTNRFLKNNFMQYAASAVIVVLVLYSGLYSFLNLGLPVYKQSIGNELNIGVTRGRLTEEFQKGVFALEEENYDEAISYLQKDARKATGDETVFYSEYLIGLTYLKSSESNFAWLYTTQDYAKLDSAIAYLKASIQDNRKPAFNNIKSNSYYYLARAYLLKNDMRRGKEYLQKVIQTKGKFADKAEEILNSFEG